MFKLWLAFISIMNQNSHHPNGICTDQWHWVSIPANLRRKCRPCRACCCAPCTHHGFCASCTMAGCSQLALVLVANSPTTWASTLLVGPFSCPCHCLSSPCWTLPQVALEGKGLKTAAVITRKACQMEIPARTIHWPKPIHAGAYTNCSTELHFRVDQLHQAPTCCFFASHQVVKLALQPQIYWLLQLLPSIIVLL